MGTPLNVDEKTLLELYYDCPMASYVDKPTSEVKKINL